MRSTHGGKGREKCLVGPKEQWKRQEEHMEGTGGFRGCAAIRAVPRQVLSFLTLLLGVPPCPGPGGSRRRLCHSHQPFTARGGLATKQLQGVPGLGPAVFCPCLEGAGAMSGVWSSTWKMKIMKGDTHMESPSCRNTPGEGGEMDGEGKQDQNDSVCK